MDSRKLTHLIQDASHAQQDTLLSVLLLNKNEVLDLCIDGEQEVTRFEKQNQQFPSRSTAPYLGQGRPPRPHSTVPSSPKLRKETIESPSNIDIDDAWHSQLAHGGTNGTCKVASMCHGGGHDARHFKVSSEKLSHFEEPRSQTMTTVEDIYEDLQDVRPPSPFFYSSSTDPVSSATSRYFAADISFQEESHGVRDFSWEQETDEKLLQRTKDVDAWFVLSPI